MRVDQVRERVSVRAARFVEEKIIIIEEQKTKQRGEELESFF